MQTKNDEYWVRQCLAGDRQAFRQLLVNHQDMVYSIAKNMLKDTDEAADLTQNIFIKAYEKLDSFRQESTFSTWLYRIAYTMSVSALRSRKTRLPQTYVDDFGRLANKADELTEEALSHEEEMQLLQTAIERLDADDRSLIHLYYIQNQSVDQIVQITGLGHSNIKTRLFRIRKKLHEWMLYQQKNVILQP